MADLTVVRMGGSVGLDFNVAHARRTHRGSLL
jgi:hypothetical protein